MLTTTGYTSQFTDLSQNTSSGNQTRGLQLINQSLRYLIQKYYFNEQQYQTLTQSQVQVYQLPFDVKDVINETVLVGGILWQPLEAPNRQMWDSLNTIPFYSDFPQFSYRFKANQIQLFPVPTSSGDPIQINYKRRVKDLSAADYTTGTLSATQWKFGGVVFTANSSTLEGTTMSYTPLPVVNDTVVLAVGSNLNLPSQFVAGTTYYIKTISAGAPSTTNPGNQDFTFTLAATQGGAAITPATSAGVVPLQGGPIISYNRSGATLTGSGTAWTTNMAGRWMKVTVSASNTTSGDDGWYQIKSVESATSLTLLNDYQGQDAVGAAYTIGETSILPEDYQDLALWRALRIYYTSIVPNRTQAEHFAALYEEGKAVLDFEFSSKSTNPVLTPQNAPVFNPNLFPRVNN